VVASPEISPSFLKRANIAPRLVELPFQKLNCPFVLAMIKRKLSVSGQATPEPISIVCAHPDLPGQYAVRQKQYHLIFVAIKSQTVILRSQGKRSSSRRRAERWSSTRAKGLLETHRDICRLRLPHDTSHSPRPWTIHLPNKPLDTRSIQKGR